MKNIIFTCDCCELDFENPRPEVIHEVNIAIGFPKLQHYHTLELCAKCNNYTPDDSIAATELLDIVIEKYIEYIKTALKQRYSK